MSAVKTGIGDAKIPNAVNADKIRESLAKNHMVAQFSKLGTKLLEQTEKPNVITLAQFEPFIPLFNLDKVRYDEDVEYQHWANRLYNQFVRGLEINLYFPTIVIRSKEDPTEVYWLNRTFTRIKADATDGSSVRDTVPAAVSKVANTTRDDMLLKASLHDLVEANKTPEQMEYFLQMRRETALMNEKFQKHNLSPEKKAALTVKSPEASSSDDDITTSIILDDDD